MLFAKTLGVIGRSLITAGVIIFLFVGYQLWGTGWQEERAQNELDDEFADLLETVNPDGAEGVTPNTVAAPGTSTPSGGPDGPDQTENTTTPPTTEAVEVPTEIPEPQPGEPMARITVDTQRTNAGDRPHMSVNKVVVASTSLEVLKKGPGHYSASSYPGTEGNSAIAGHRTTYGQPFHNIDHLQPGDTVTVQTFQGLFEYEVMSAADAIAIPDSAPLPAEASEDEAAELPEGDEATDETAFDTSALTGGQNFDDLRRAQEASLPSFLNGPEGSSIVVNPDATWVLGDFGDDRLTLTACHPKYTARQRIVVSARLVGEAVPAPTLLPTESAPEAPTTTIPADEPEIAEVATDPELDLETGLAGDQSALVPAIAWFGAALLTWALGWLAVREVSNVIVLPVATAAMTVLAFIFWPSEVRAALPLALAGVAIWAVLWLGTRRLMHWFPYLQVAALALFGLAPCFYYLDRYLPA